MASLAEFVVSMTPDTSRLNIESLFIHTDAGTEPNRVRMNHDALHRSSFVSNLLHCGSQRLIAPQSYYAVMINPMCTRRVGTPSHAVQKSNAEKCT